MNDEIINLWKEDSDYNVVKTWLVGGTGGQTFSILDRFIPRIKVDDTMFVYDFGDIEQEVDEIIGGNTITSWMMRTLTSGHMKL